MLQVSEQQQQVLQAHFLSDLNLLQVPVYFPNQLHLRHSVQQLQLLQQISLVFQHRQQLQS